MLLKQLPIQIDSTVKVQLCSMTNPDNSVAKSLSPHSKAVGEWSENRTTITYAGLCKAICTLVTHEELSLAVMGFLLAPQ